MMYRLHIYYEMIGGQLEEATGLSERFPIRIFNQKQLFEMTKDAQLLLQYIDSQWDSIGWRKSLDSTKNKPLLIRRDSS